MSENDMNRKYFARVERWLIGFACFWVVLAVLFIIPEIILKWKAVFS